MDNIPDRFSLAFSREIIAERVQQLGEEISCWTADVWRKSGEQVLAVCILRGGVFFFSDLLRALKTTVEPSFIRTYAYSSSENRRTASAVRVSMGDVAAHGRSILMVDDICDTGATLLKLHNVFAELGAAEVRSAVLIHRQVSDSLFTPNWSAFQYCGREWFVGYGMEDKNHYANLDGVYTIKG